jgi:hypothetical protein
MKEVTKMTRPYLAFLATFIVAALTGSCNPVLAGSVTGEVTDKYKTNTPVYPASVSLLDRNKGTILPGSSTMTGADGSYTINNVPAGKYAVVVQAGGYLPDGTSGTPVPDTDFPTDGNNATAPAAKMTQSSGTLQYVKGIAAAIEEKALGSKADLRKVLTNEWGKLASINLPPSSRVIIAHELGNKEKLRLSEFVPETKDYLKVKPEEVRSAEALYDEVYLGKKPQPNKSVTGDFHLTEDLLADVAIYQLKKTAGTKQQKVFREDFLKMWSNSPVEDRILGAEKHGLLRPPLINPVK